MKTHVQIVAVLHLAFGAVSLLGAITVLTCLGLAGSIVLSQGEHEAAGILGIVAVVLGAFLFVLALPELIGGWALFTGRRWARPLVAVLGILQLINIPFGTALGIYTLWVLAREPEDPPPNASKVQSTAPQTKRDRQKAVQDAGSKRG